MRERERERERENEALHIRLTTIVQVLCICHTCACTCKTTDVHVVFAMIGGRLIHIRAETHAPTARFLYLNMSR